MSEVNKSLPELERDVTEAESAFRAAATAEPFVGHCEKVRQSAARHRTAEEALAAVRKEHGVDAASVVAESGDLLQRAQRAALGIPTIDDLRHAIFNGGRKRGGKGGDAPEVNLALQLAEEDETRARNAFYADLDRFTESTRKLKRHAVRFVEAKNALEAAQTGVTPVSAKADIDAEALDEMQQLPVLNGLGEFYVPR